MEARNVGVAAMHRSVSGGVGRSRGRQGATLCAGAYAWCPDIDYLADGVTSSVYRCRDVRSGNFFAIKVFKDRPPDRELELLQKLSHKNIVGLIAREQFEDLHGTQRVGLVLEYCPGGSLHDLLKRPENWLGLPDSELLTLLYNMSDGLGYLREQQKVLHRDIKPGNILISWDSKRQLVFKLADFGSSRELEDDGEFQSLVGTYEFLHPSIYMEVYRRLHAGGGHARSPGAGHKAECDLWSLGVTLYQAATGQLPFAPYEGVRNNHKLMIDMMVKKPAGSICAVQESPNGEVRYSDRLPAECQLSASVSRLLVAILQGILACDFNVQWSFSKFFETVSAQRAQHATYYFVAASMCKPDLLFSAKPTYESLLQSLAECSGYSKDEIVVQYRSQTVTAFPTGTTPQCPIIVLSKQRFACSLSADQLDLGFVSRCPREPDPANVKAVKDYVEEAYRMCLACRDVAKMAHLHHSLVLEAKEATLCLFRQRSQEAQQRAGSKIAMVSSSQQKVGRLLELAMLVRAQAPDETFSDVVMDWHRKLESVSAGLQEMQSDLPASGGDAALERLAASCDQLLAAFGRPALAAECLSGAVQRAELVHDRYQQIVGLYKRGHQTATVELIRSGFESDRKQLAQSVADCQRVVRTCCVETMMSVGAKFDEWLRRVQLEVQRLAALELRLQADIEAELDLLHDKVCRGTHEVLRGHFCSRNATKAADFGTLDKAIQGLIESTELVQVELSKNSDLLKGLDELGLRNSGLSSLESHASAESQ